MPTRKKNDTTDYVQQSIGEMKEAINNLNTNLSTKIENLDIKLNVYNEKFTDRIATLEERSKQQLFTKVLLTLLGVAFGFILNHILVQYFTQ